MGMTGRCAFADGHCKTKASADAEYCPRHTFMVDTMGLEAALDAELGPAWRIDIRAAIAKVIYGDLNNA